MGERMGGSAVTAGPTLPAEDVDPAGEPDDGRPEDAAALVADWGSSRRRRATGIGPRLGARGWLRWGWRQLTSMRTALVLLGLLAVAAIPGSVLPQRGPDQLAVNAWIASHPGVGPALDRLGAFDAFVSPWFSAIYLLLFISLIGCVLPRIRAHAAAIRQPTPAAPRRLNRLAGATGWATDRPAEVLDSAHAALRAQRWRVTRGPVAADGSGSLAAERGLARETGNLLFHVALVLLLVGVAAGALFGWKGTVIVREGRGFANTLTQYDTFAPGRLASAGDLPPFSFTLTDFEATYERDEAQRGAPRSFSAELAWSASPDAATQNMEVEVNRPLRVDGAKVFLVGHGYAPRLRLTDAAGDVVFDDTVVFLPQDGAFTSTGVLKAPDASPQLAFTAIFAPTAAVTPELGPHSTFPAADLPGLFVSAWTGDLGMDDGVPKNVFSLDTAGLTQLGIQGMQPGQGWQLPDGKGTLELLEVQEWASFTIAYDPGKGLALAGAVLAVVGLMHSLFVKRRRIWVRVDPALAAPDRFGAEPEPEGARVWRVQVAGLSRTDAADVAAEVEQLVARIRPETEQTQEGGAT